MTARVEGERRVPVRDSNIWLRQSGSENVAYDPKRETVHVMNATAVAIWVLCDGETEPREMIDAVIELTGLPYEVVREDVERILQEFEAAGIVTWNGA